MDKDGSGAVEKNQIFSVEWRRWQKPLDNRGEHHSFIVKKYQSLCFYDFKTKMAWEIQIKLYYEGYGYSIEQEVAQ